MEDLIRSLTSGFVAPIGRFPASPILELDCPTLLWTNYEFMRSIIFLSSLTLSYRWTTLHDDGTISKLTFQTRLVVFHVRPRSWNFLKRVLNWIFHPRRTSHPGSSHLLRWTDGSLWISRHQGEPQLHHQSGNLSGCRLYRQNYFSQFWEVFPENLYFILVRAPEVWLSSVINRNNSQIVFWCTSTSFTREPPKSVIHRTPRTIPSRSWCGATWTSRYRVSNPRLLSWICCTCASRVNPLF